MRNAAGNHDQSQNPSTRKNEPTTPTTTPTARERVDPRGRDARGEGCGGLRDGVWRSRRRSAGRGPCRGPRRRGCRRPARRAPRRRARRPRRARPGRGRRAAGPRSGRARWARRRGTSRPSCPHGPAVAASVATMNVAAIRKAQVAIVEYASFGPPVGRDVPQQGGLLDQQWQRRPAISTGCRTSRRASRRARAVTVDRPTSRSAGASVCVVSAMSAPRSPRSGPRPGPGR